MDTYYKVKLFMYLLK